MTAAEREERVREAVRRCALGEEPKAIARALSVSRGSVERWTKPLRQCIRRYQRAMARRWAQEGRETAWIAGELGLSIDTIQAWRRTAGLARPRGGSRKRG